MSMTTGQKVAVWTLGLGAALAATYITLKPSESGAPALGGGPRGFNGGPGWYVAGFNYEKGNPDRRLKHLDGPFATKAEADDKASEEADAWHVIVKHTSAGGEALSAQLDRSSETGSAWRKGSGGRGRAKQRRRAR